MQRIFRGLFWNRIVCFTMSLWTPRPLRSRQHLRPVLGLWASETTSQFPLAVRPLAHLLPFCRSQVGEPFSLLVWLWALMLQQWRATSGSWPNREQSVWFLPLGQR